jgi:beta-lactamase regulating signal transducer with metallopeptidase domain/protocatechuate 3,4-dioxygenase beta subunit
MLSPFTHWLLIAIDCSVKSLLLAAVVFLLLRVLKVRNSSARHRVWAAVLCGMLALPVLSRIVPAVPLPFSVDTAWLDVFDEYSAPESVAELPARAITDVQGTAVQVDEPVLAGNDLDNHFAPEWNTMPNMGFGIQQESVASEVLPRIEAVDENVTFTAEVDESPATVATVIPWYIPVIRWLPISVAAVWLTGAFVMLFRLVLGLLATRGIVRRATDVSENVQPVATLLAAQRGNVFESSEIRVPVTVGLLSPSVLLPIDWSEWSKQKLEAVMTHEHTHVERHDFLFAVLAEVNRCLYWFHPLSWWLRTELSDLAEEACDDAAIGLTGDPAGYARHLLEVAGALSRGEGRVCQPGMSMARQSNVEGRITTILDLTRPLSERLTWKTTIAIMALMLPAIAMVAALRPTPPKSDPVTTTAKDPATTDGTQNAEPVFVQFDDEPAAPAKAGLSPTVELAGRVVDPEGNPVAGAKLLLTRWDMPAPSADEKPLAVTKADGTFQVKVDREACKSFASVMVLADGFGFASRSAMALEESGRMISELPEMQQKHIKTMAEDWGPDLKLRLDDVPLRGRILNPEGQIVSGARVSVTEVWESKDGSLDKWEEATKVPRADYYSIREKAPISLNGPRTERIARVEVADDGSFTVHGIGRDRIVRMTLMAPGIAGAHVYARTRTGETIKLPDQWERSSRFQTWYGNDFSHVSGATQPVEGRVTDRDTGKPIEGVRLIANMLSGSNFNSMLDHGFINATTDRDGRYRLEGLPVGRNEFVVLPELESGYVRVAQSAKISASSEPLTKDIKIRRGVILTGRAVDLTTGMGLEGQLNYFAFKTNPAFSGEDRIRLAGVDMQHDRSDQDGRFSMTVLPGRGIIGFMADNAGDFPRGAGANNIESNDDSRIEGDPELFRTLPHLARSSNFNYLAGFDASPAEPPKLKMRLQSGMSFVVRVVDSNGEELKDYLFYGARKTSGWYSSDLDHGKVVGHKENSTRRLFAWNPTSNEAGTLLIEGMPPKNPVIRLQPAGVITGRLVDKDGDPLAGVAIRCNARVNGYFGLPAESTDLGSFPEDQDTRREELFTDSNGHFKIRGVLPGLKYSAVASKAVENPSEMMAKYLGELFKDVMIEGAETKDLGDVKAQQHEHENAVAVPLARGGTGSRLASGRHGESTLPDEPKTGEPHVASGQTTDPTPATQNLNGFSRAEISLGGVIVDEQSKPIAGAELLVPFWKVDPPTSVDDVGSRRVGTSDSEGRFLIKFTDEFVRHGKTQLIARMPGRGIGGLQLELRDLPESVKVVLPSEQIIRGKLVTTEGQPVAGAAISIYEVLKPTDSLDKFLTMFKNDWNQAPHRNCDRLYLDRDLLQNPVSDKDGYFEIRGIAAEHVCRAAANAKGLAGKGLWLVNRSDLDVSDFNRHPLEFAGATVPLLAATDATHVLEPELVISGTVTDEEGNPVAGAMLQAGSDDDDVKLATADNDGRYDLTGMPHAENTLVAVMAPGFMARPATDVLLGQTIVLKPRSSDTRIQQDFKLRRGVVVTGQIVDASTGEGVQASIRTSPMSHNEYASIPGFDKYKHDGTTQPTEKDGRFRILTIPGPQVLSVSGRGSIQIGKDKRNPYLQATVAPEDSEYLKVDTRGNERRIFTIDNRVVSLNRLNAVAYLNPPAGDDTGNLTVQLHRGKMVDVEFVDEAGEPVSNVFLSGVTGMSWGTAQAPGSQVTIYALENNEPRQLLCLHEQRKLAATLMVAGDENSPVRITLKKATTVRGRAVDRDGQQLSGRSVFLNFKGDTADELYRFFNMDKPQVVVDEDGRFEIPLVVPNVKFRAEVHPTTTDPGLIGYPSQDSIAVASEDLDLGDVTFTKYGMKVIKNTGPKFETKK